MKERALRKAGKTAELDKTKSKTAKDEKEAKDKLPLPKAGGISPGNGGVLTCDE